jgi:hypothetical protein
MLIRVHPWLKTIPTAWFQLRKQTHPVDPVRITTQPNSPAAHFHPPPPAANEKNFKKTSHRNLLNSNY